eukprot:TRINITY_DN60955_c0_g1_i1.p1 TRINITY_DN60955_c0_g1~~TRINITY_DN60955_c0_g1_i1.p1  ORF type:complete len:1044 (+),score=229.78 TRINITY_DN60955_c0_g1_i1:50-3181(+)
MFDFDGKVDSSSRVDMGGRGGRKARAGAAESRQEFVKRQHKEREHREKMRLREAASKKIQAVYRGHRCRQAQRAEKRQVFDKRQADISKVGAVLPAPQKAKFVFHALIPMLRLFVFFFRRGEDATRLSTMLDLVLQSGAQEASCNIFQLLLAEDAQADAKGTSRRSVLALLEKFISALLASGRGQDAARLLLSLQGALFSPAPDFKPLDVKSGAAVAQLLRRTEVLPILAGEVLSSSALASQPPAQAAALVLLLSSGIESVNLSTVEASLCSRQELLSQLLSAPGLCDFLCDAQASAPAASEGLRRLCSLVVTTAGVLQRGPPASTARPCTPASLLDNLLALLERLVLQSVSSSVAGELTSWMAWLSWAKEQTGKTSGSQASAAALGRLYRGSFVRLLLSSLDRGGSDGLLALCRLFFAPSDGAGESECDPPPEVLQTLAFATPLAERLFPTFGGLIRNRSVEAVFEALGPPTLATSEAIRLRVFCAVYALQLQPMYDYEFFGAANPLRLEEVQELLPFLNRLCFHFVTSLPDQATLGPAAKALRTSLTSLVNLLYHRHRRRPILQDDKAWIIPESRSLLRRAPVVVDLGEDGTDEAMAADEEDEAMDVDEEGPQASDAPAGQSSSSAVDSRATGSVGQAERALQAVLAEIPHVLPFEDRVSILHNAILADQEQRRDTRGPWGPSAMDKHQIRRTALVEDGFTAFEGLNDERELRDLFRVEFIAPDGSPESGVDGGGLFKEFMVLICREMFDPEFGLFSATSDQTLYPSTMAFGRHRNAAELYTFLGKVVGKAIYEMMLLEPQFSRVFVNRLLGRTNEVDDVAALDKELHKNMLQIKESDDVESLGITFSISVEGAHRDVDLVPNGSNIAVTKENLTRYFHLMANYRTNVQFQRHTTAFLSGLQKVVPLAWLKMFDPYELNTLISGTTSAGFDVADLKANTVYSGGYQADSPCVVWLWQLLEQADPDDQGRFLMFITSCSRAPLLGFKNLYPKFAIHRVPDSERLPTSATCANLLKLPDYVNFESLKSKVLQAIRAEAGFDLS